MNIRSQIARRVRTENGLFALAIMAALYGMFHLAPSARPVNAAGMAWAAGACFLGGTLIRLPMSKRARRYTWCSDEDGRVEASGPIDRDWEKGAHAFQVGHGFTLVANGREVEMVVVQIDHRRDEGDDTWTALDRVTYRDANRYSGRSWSPLPPDGLEPARLDLLEAEVRAIFEHKPWRGLLRRSKHRESPVPPLEESL